MRSDFIQSDVQDANERRRQPVAAFNAAPTTPTESFASFLNDPREAAHARAQSSALSSSLVAAAPPGPPASPFKGISAFTGSPAVIPSAVVPPVEALVETSPAAATEAPLGFAAAQPTPAEIAPASEAASTAATPAAATPAAVTTPETPAASAETSPALNALSGRRQPTPAFAAAKSETAQAPVQYESVKGAAANGARGLTAEESTALANGDASMTPKGPSLFGEDGMTVADFFSIINPLQHLPLVGALYRDITGDTIKPGARVLGGMLFGGPMGMVSGAFNAAVENDIGTDTGGALLALMRGKPIGGPSDSNLASAPRPAPEAAAATAGEAAPGVLPTASLAAAPKALTPAQAQAPAPTPAPLPVSAPRVFSPPKQPAPAEARVITPASAPASVSAAPSNPAEAASAEPSKSAIPVSFAPAAPAAAAAGGKEFAVNSGGKEFAVPARMNNVQPRQPVPVVRADLSRARELAPMAPLTARSESPRPDHTPSPAQLLTPGLTPSGVTPSGLMTPGLTPGAASNVPLGMPGLPQSALPDAMTRALDKYDALLKSRKGGVVNQQS